MLSWKYIQSLGETRSKTRLKYFFDRGGANMQVQDWKIEGDNVVTSELFGGNLLAPTIPLLGNGSYEQAIDYLGTTGLRFPGGSLTEYGFDINNPDLEEQYFSHLDVTWNMIPLTEFMNFAGENNHPVTIVIPTRTQLSEHTDDNGDRFPEIDEVSVRSFVAKTLNGEYGSANIEAFEIGNEYWGSGEMNAVEYGRLASEMAVIIDEELQNAGKDETSILVQKGNNFHFSKLSDDYDGVPPNDALEDINQTYSVDLGDDALFSSGDINWAYVNAKIIMSQFNDQEWDAIDGVVTHIYSRGDIAESTRYFDLDQMNKTWLAEDPDLNIHITEWNLKSEPSLDRDNDYGLFQAQEILQIMEEFVRTGVDNAHVWPLIQRTANPLSEGVEFNGPTPPGEMYALMSETLPGKTLIDLNPSHRDTEWTDGPVSTHMYAGEDELVLYVMNGSKAGATNFDVSVSDFISDFSSFEALVLGVEEGDSPGDNSSTPVVEELSDQSYAEGILELSLSPGEVAQIIFTGVEPTAEFASLWELANSENPFAEEDGSAPVVEDDVSLPVVDPIEEPEVIDEEVEVDEDDGGFGIELGIGLLFLLSLAGGVGF